MLVNLHSHLEGRVRPGTAAELAPALGVPEPAGGWAGALALDGPGDLTVFLAKVASTYPFFADPDALARITAEAVEDAAAAGEDYLELRFGPASHTRDGVGLDDVVAAACAGAAEGARRSGIAAGVVVAILRHHGDDVNEAVARAAARRAGDGVVGFDLAGDELRFPALDRHRTAFGIAAAAGLGLTCHAAEAAPASAAVDAVRRFGVTRIGHGAHLRSDATAMAELADRGVVVEVCPTSNVFTGAIATLEEHPAPVFRDAGLPLVVGDDNPRQTGSGLATEYQVLRRLGFTDDDLDRLVDSSIDAGFMEPSVRAALLTRRDAARPRLGPGVSRRPPGPRSGPRRSSA